MQFSCLLCSFQSHHAWKMSCLSVVTFKEKLHILVRTLHKKLKDIYRVLRNTKEIVSTYTSCWSIYNSKSIWITYMSQMIIMRISKISVVKINICRLMDIKQFSSLCFKKLHSSLGIFLKLNFLYFFKFIDVLQFWS